jgi:hypothetical protein
MNESTAWTIVASVVVISFTLGCGYGCQQTEKTRQDAIKAGLVEEFQPGLGKVWTKPEEQ